MSETKAKFLFLSLDIYRLLTWWLLTHVFLFLACLLGFRSCRRNASTAWTKAKNRWTVVPVFSVSLPLDSCFPLKACCSAALLLCSSYFSSALFWTLNLPHSRNLILDSVFVAWKLPKKKKKIKAQSTRLPDLEVFLGFPEGNPLKGLFFPPFHLCERFLFPIQYWFSPIIKPYGRFSSCVWAFRFLRACIQCQNFNFLGNGDQRS